MGGDRLGRGRDAPVISGLRSITEESVSRTRLRWLRIALLPPAEPWR